MKNSNSTIRHAVKNNLKRVVSERGGKSLKQLQAEIEAISASGRYGDDSRPVILFY